jgi:hypothetical protein
MSRAMRPTVESGTKACERSMARNPLEKTASDDIMAVANIG